MDTIILHVTYTCKPGKAQEFVDALKKGGLQQAVRSEDGCMQYDYHLSCEAADTVVLLEEWRDSAALSAHMAQPHMKEIGKVKDTFVDRVTLQRFE